MNCKTTGSSFERIKLASVTIETSQSSLSNLESLKFLVSGFIMQEMCEKSLGKTKLMLKKQTSQT